MLAAIFVALIFIFYIILPGVYICNICKINEHLLGASISIGMALFLAIYSLNVSTGLYALFWALPPLLGGAGLFNLLGGRASLKLNTLYFTALPIFIFSLAILPAVALPIFSAVPLSDISVYTTAAAQLNGSSGNLDIFNLTASAIKAITGQPFYSITSFYLPIFSLLLLCISLYDLSDRLLKNQGKALFAVLIFLLCSPFTLPGLDGGLFAGEDILYSGSKALALAVTASVVLSAERAVASKKPLALLPAIAGYIVVCLFEPSYAGILLLTLLLSCAVQLATGRRNTNLLLLLLAITAIFAILCFNFYSTISLAPGLPQGLQIDSLLRSSYIVSPILYYILLPIGFVIAILAALLPIFPALIKGFTSMFKRLSTTGFGTTTLIFASLISAVCAFLLDGGYEVLSSLSMLFGSILAAKMFAYRAPLVKAAVITSMAIGVFNISLLLIGGVSLQLQSFGYFSYPEQQMLEPELIEAVSYIRDNTPEGSAVATDHLLGSTIISALSERGCETYDTEVLEQSNKADYLLLYNQGDYNLQNFTLLYSSDSYIVAGQ